MLKSMYKDINACIHIHKYINNICMCTCIVYLYSGKYICVLYIYVYMHMCIYMYVYSNKEHKNIRMNNHKRLSCEDQETMSR